MQVIRIRRAHKIILMNFFSSNLNMQINIICPIMSKIY